MSTTIQDNRDAAPASLPARITRGLIVAYGGTAYLICLGTLLYAFGFVTNLIVRRQSTSARPGQRRGPC